MLTTINGNDLSFIDEGQGQTILFVHGFPLSRAIWQPQIEALKQSVRALVLFCTRAGADSEEGKSGREELAKRAEREGASAVAEQMLPKMLAPATASSRPEMAEQVRQIMLATSINGLAGSLRGMAARPSALDLLPEDYN